MTFEELDEIAAKHGLIKHENTRNISYEIEHQIFPSGSDILIFFDFGTIEDEENDTVCLLTKLGELNVPGYCTLYTEDGELGDISGVSVDQVEQFIMERKETFDKMLPRMLQDSIEYSESTLTYLLK